MQYDRHKRNKEAVTASCGSVGIGPLAIEYPLSYEEVLVRPHTRTHPIMSIVTTNYHFSSCHSHFCVAIEMGTVPDNLDIWPRCPNRAKTWLERFLGSGLHEPDLIFKREGAAFA